MLKFLSCYDLFFRLWYPAALSFLGSSITGDGSSSVVAVAEGSQVSLV